MLDASIDPSELHLKKGLSALQKSRFLRDPDTSSSWRSPLSTRSLAASSGWNCTLERYGNGIQKNSVGENTYGGAIEIESNLSSRSEADRKKVFLYNWRHQSGRSARSTKTSSGESGLKLDRNNAPGRSGDSSSDASNGTSKSTKYLDNSITVFRATQEKLESVSRRMSRKLKTSNSLKQNIGGCSTMPSALDLLSSPLAVLNSVEQSDETEYCNFEDLGISTQNLNSKSGYSSRSGSPLLARYATGSGGRYFKDENWSHSSKFLKSSRREGSSYTPASTSSYNRNGEFIPSTAGSWDGTSSLNDDELDQLDLPGSRGCGIPCYWSKRLKSRGSGGCYSPSLSDTLRRKGSIIFCGSQPLYHKRSMSTSHKQKSAKSGRRLPLLVNGGNRGASSGDAESDELSTNFGELDLEASSRLDGRRWSSCKSQEGLELALTPGTGELVPDHVSLSKKYAPRSFNELIGQNIVVQSLVNAISREKIAPVYLFQGPHGTGKTSTARIFATSLNCLSEEETKPCGFCRECTDFSTGKSLDLRELDATDKKGIDRARYMLKNSSMAPAFSRYRVFIIKDCHLLSSKIWAVFLKFLEEPPSHVVFMFITSDPDNLPRAVVSRCQRYLFPKIKESDMVSRLKMLAVEENLDVEADALDLIALNSDGSLQEAEMMLEQLSLLGKRITPSLVNELVGVVSDEKLLDLLELAMSSDTAETVKRARELMDYGVDPMSLMSQLAGLIMDIIAGTYQLVDSKGSGSFFGQRSLTESELDRLKQALKILSEAEKQLRFSSERSTWFTAALLQLGSSHSSARWSNGKQSPKKLKGNATDNRGLAISQASDHKKKQNVLHGHTSPRLDPSSSNSKVLNFSFESVDRHNESDAITLRCLSPCKLDEIWRRSIEGCHSMKLRLLLSTHGKLVSISEEDGLLIAFIAFENRDIKSRAESFLSSITNSIEMVLRCNVEVRVGLVSDGKNSLSRITPAEMPNSTARKQMEITQVADRERKVDSNKSSGSTEQEPHKEPLKVPNNSLNDSISTSRRTHESCDASLVPNESFGMAGLPFFSMGDHSGGVSTRISNQDLAMERTDAVIDEQRLESAWLQAAEKGTPRSVSRLRPERNQVLPSMLVPAVASQYTEEEIKHKIPPLKINDSRGHQKDQRRRGANHCALSPSLLHSRSPAPNFNNENLGHESGPSCSRFLCWKTSIPHKEKVKQRARIQSHKHGCFLWVGQRGKSKLENRFR